MTDSIQKLRSLLENVRTFKETMQSKYQTEIVMLNKELESAHDQARTLKRSLLIKLIKGDSNDDKQKAVESAKTAEKQPVSLSLDAIEQLMHKKKI